MYRGDHGSLSVLMILYISAEYSPTIRRTLNQERGEEKVELNHPFSFPLSVISRDQRETRVPRRSDSSIHPL